MAHSYRKLQHWNLWLAQHFLGESLLDAEQQLLPHLLDKHFGKHALVIGVPNQTHLLNAITLPHPHLISPLTPQDKKENLLEGDFYELPIHTGTIDLVIVPHTLDFVDNPRQLLSEACRVVKPEGLLVIYGFNPYSAWGLKRIWSKHTSVPWSGAFIPPGKIKRWLNLVDFKLEQQNGICFRPPLHNKKMYQKLNFLEKLGNRCFPLWGGTYVLLARAKVIPLTPIKMQWKQQLDGIRITPTVSGPIARSVK